MVDKEKLFSMIDHCLYYSGESYAAVFYTEYREVVNGSVLKEEEKEDCNKVLEYLINGSLEHLEVLRKLKEAVRKNGKTVY